MEAARSLGLTHTHHSSSAAAAASVAAATASAAAASAPASAANPRHQQQHLHHQQHLHQQLQHFQLHQHHVQQQQLHQQHHLQQSLQQQQHQQRQHVRRRRGVSERSVNSRQRLLASNTSLALHRGCSAGVKRSGVDRASSRRAAARSPRPPTSPRSQHSHHRKHAGKLSEVNLSKKLSPKASPIRSANVTSKTKVRKSEKRVKTRRVCAALPSGPLRVRGGASLVSATHDVTSSAGVQRRQKTLPNGAVQHPSTQAPCAPSTVTHTVSVRNTVTTYKLPAGEPHQRVRKRSKTPTGRRYSVPLKDDLTESLPQAISSSDLGDSLTLDLYPVVPSYTAVPTNGGGLTLAPSPNTSSILSRKVSAPLAHSRVPSGVVAAAAPGQVSAHRVGVVASVSSAHRHSKASEGVALPLVATGAGTTLQARRSASSASRGGGGAGGGRPPTAPLRPGRPPPKALVVRNPHQAAQARGLNLPLLASGGGGVGGGGGGAAKREGEWPALGKSIRRVPGSTTSALQSNPNCLAGTDLTAFKRAASPRIVRVRQSRSRSSGLPRPALRAAARARRQVALQAPAALTALSTHTARPTVAAVTTAGPLRAATAAAAVALPSRPSAVGAAVAVAAARSALRASAPRREKLKGILVQPPAIPRSARPCGDVADHHPVAGRALFPTLGVRSGIPGPGPATGSSRTKHASLTALAPPRPQRKVAPTRARNSPPRHHPPLALRGGNNDDFQGAPAILPVPLPPHEVAFSVPIASADALPLPEAGVVSTNVFSFLSVVSERTEEQSTTQCRSPQLSPTPGPSPASTSDTSPPPSGCQPSSGPDSGNTVASNGTAPGARENTTELASTGSVASSQHPSREERSPSLVALREAIFHSDEPFLADHPPSPSTMALNRSRAGLASSSSGIYHLKRVEFDGKRLPIVMQNENGPCPLIAIANTLLLRGRIAMPEMVSVVNTSQLVEYVADAVTDTVSDAMLSALGSDSQTTDAERRDADARANAYQNAQDAIAVLPELQRGLDVNVRFTGVRDFEATRGCVVFDVLRIPLYHGWLVDPQCEAAARAVAGLGYNELVEHIVAHKESADERLAASALQAEEFLASTASQLTYHGLCELNTTARDGEIAVFFRNNHFSTLYKRNGRLYLLVTDQGFLHEPTVVWETLSTIDGDAIFVDGRFRQSQCEAPAPPAPLSPADAAARSRQIANDEALARAVDEEERRAAAMREARHRAAQQAQMSQQPGQQGLYPPPGTSGSASGGGVTVVGRVPGPGTLDTCPITPPPAASPAAVAAATAAAAAVAAAAAPYTSAPAGQPPQHSSNRTSQNSGHGGRSPSPGRRPS